MLDKLTIDDATARDLIEPLYVTSCMSPRDVARSLSHCVPYEQVVRITSNIRHQRSRKARRGGHLGRTLNIAVSTDVFDALTPHARRRGLSVSRLAARLVDASIDCVDAILDDLP